MAFNHRKKERYGGNNVLVNAKVQKHTGEGECVL